MPLTNAREALGRKLAESSAAVEAAGRGRAKPSAWRRRRERIEVYDNSHIMGTNAVGGMIVAGPEGFMKSQYRKFNIRSPELTPGDDFGDDARGAAPPLRAPRSRSRHARASREDAEEGTASPARPGADRRRRGPARRRAWR